jgi:hypothetical protein
MLGSASAPKEPKALSAKSAFALSNGAEDHMASDIGRSSRTSFRGFYGEAEMQFDVWVGVISSRYHEVATCSIRCRARSNASVNRL